VNHYGDTTGSDLTVDGSETASENIVEHEESVLTNPVSQGVDLTGLQRVKSTVNMGPGIIVTAAEGSEVEAK
jgi:hypothetical protein